MPKSRLPEPIWRVVRRTVWMRDGGRCRHCGQAVALATCHIDHMRSGRTAGNGRGNLRTLCPPCHALRADRRHRRVTRWALQHGLIPPDWRSRVWRG